jgi:hypothetical protein
VRLACKQQLPTQLEPPPTTVTFGTDSSALLVASISVTVSPTVAMLGCTALFEAMLVFEHVGGEQSA